MLLDTQFFCISAIQQQTLTVLGDTTLRQCIRDTQTYNKEVSEALETLLVTISDTFSSFSMSFHYFPLCAAPMTHTTYELLTDR